MASSLAKEMQIRRRILSIYNKTQADFDDLKDWGDYEESREDIIYNLSEGIDVEATQKKVEAYEKLNADDILRNQALKANSQWKQGKSQHPGLADSTSQLPADGGGLDPSSSKPEDLTYRPADVLVQVQHTLPQAIVQESQPRERKKLSLEEVGAISGWTPDMPRRKAREEVYQSLFCF